METQIITIKMMQILNPLKDEILVRFTEKIFLYFKYNNSKLKKIDRSIKSKNGSQSECDSKYNASPTIGGKSRRLTLKSNFGNAVGNNFTVNKAIKIR